MTTLVEQGPWLRKYIGQADSNTEDLERIVQAEILHDTILHASRSDKKTGAEGLKQLRALAIEFLGEEVVLAIEKDHKKQGIHKL